MIIHTQMVKNTQMLLTEIAKFTLGEEATAGSQSKPNMHIPLAEGG